MSDLSLIHDSQYLLSSSWDKSLRLWNLKSGKCMLRFSAQGQKELLSVAFSSDGRQIFSAGCDYKVSLWNIKGELKMSSTQ